MSSWGAETPAAAPGNDSWDVGAGGSAAWNDGGAPNMAATRADGFDAGNDNFAGDGDAGGDSCRNCGQEGHFARECPEPSKGGGACFNCGQEGHNKSDCTEPRVFKGECRNCNQEGHMASDCPTFVHKCKNCQQEGKSSHAALECKNPKALDKTGVAEKSEEEAWNLLKQASDERDIGDFKEALQILSKACPDYTYPQLEKEFRTRKFSIYMIAMEKDHGEDATWTNVNLQGDVGKKYGVSYFTSAEAQRPTLVEKWPASPEENMTHLAEAGVPLDRGVEKCSNCNKLGHVARRCPDERMASVQPAITCFLCGEEGHRVRDCAQDRKPAGRACKICESEEHLAKDCPNKEKRACRVCGDEEHMAADCPNKEKRTCRNCGDEDNISKDCTQPRKVTCNICSEEGHMARDCTRKAEFPRQKVDWAKVVCSNCHKNGHGRARCPEAEGAGDAGKDNGGADAGGGAGWGAPAATGSAPAEWETAQPADAFGGGGGAGGGW